jgi:hypothetical protein
MDKDAQSFGLVLGTIASKCPIRCLLPCAVTYAQVAVIPCCPMIEGKDGLFGFIIVYLHGALPIHRVSVWFIPKIMNIPSGIWGRLLIPLKHCIRTTNTHLPLSPFPPQTGGHGTRTNKV